MIDNVRKGVNYTKKMVSLTEEGSVLSRFGRAAQQLEDVGASGVDDSDDSSSKSRPVDDSVVLLE